MAHQFTSGAFLHNKPAWHRLGVVVDGTLPVREAFRLEEADFSVAVRPVFEADMQFIAGHQAITRLDSGRTLSVMAESYTPIQNEALIRIAEALHEAWAAYQAVTEYLSHEAGRSKDPDLAARQRFESPYWGPSAERIAKAHRYTLTIWVLQQG